MQTRKTDCGYSTRDKKTERWSQDVIDKAPNDFGEGTTNDDTLSLLFAAEQVDAGQVSTQVEGRKHDNERDRE